MARRAIAPGAPATSAAPRQTLVTEGPAEGRGRTEERSRSSCAARRAATPSASRRTKGLRPSPSRHCMMPKPISAAEPDPRSAASCSVTMDSHLASAATRAAASLRRELPGLQLVMHAADEWGSDPDALAACAADIAAGRHRHRRRCCSWRTISARCSPPSTARRDQCDAMLCCHVGVGSDAADPARQVQHVRIEAVGAIGMLKRLRGKGGSGGGGGSSGRRPDEDAAPAAQALLRFIPGTAQDVRAYFLALQYWLAGSEENLGNLVRLLVDRYATGARASLAGKLRGRAAAAISRRRPLPPAASRTRIAERIEQLPGAGANGTVGLLLMRSYVLSGNAGHYDGAIAALEARGLRVIPAFASGLDQRPAIERFFMRDGSADRRRGGVADRLLASRRPRLQRRTCRRDGACGTRRALCRGPPGRIPDPGAVAGRSARAAAGRGDDDGCDSGARRRDLPDDVRRPLELRAERAAPRHERARRARSHPRRSRRRG